MVCIIQYRPYIEDLYSQSEQGLRGLNEEQGRTVDGKLGVSWFRIRSILPLDQNPVTPSATSATSATSASRTTPKLAVHLR